MFMQAGVQPAPPSERVGTLVLIKRSQGAAFFRREQGTYTSFDNVSYGVQHLTGKPPIVVIICCKRLSVGLPLQEQWMPGMRRDDREAAKTRRGEERVFRGDLQPRLLIAAIGFKYTIVNAASRSLAHCRIVVTYAHLISDNRRIMNRGSRAFGMAVRKHAPNSTADFDMNRLIPGRRLQNIAVLRKLTGVIAQPYIPASRK
jgi:hypothetical protein